VRAADEAAAAQQVRFARAGSAAGHRDGADAEVVRQDDSYTAAHAGIRRLADADAAFVKRLGAGYGLETVILSADVKKLAKKHGYSTEHAARNARYALLGRTALRKGCRLVATAHHSDDHAETVLLNLLRGTEPKGLLGIPERRPLCGKGKARVELIRPLLAVSRREIEEYLQANSLPSRKDHTNEDEYYTRNWIRRTLLPLMLKKQPRLREHLEELSAKLAPLLPRGPHAA